MFADVPQFICLELRTSEDEDQLEKILISKNIC